MIISRIIDEAVLSNTSPFGEHNTSYTPSVVSANSHPMGIDYCSLSW